MFPGKQIQKAIDLNGVKIIIASFILAHILFKQSHEGLSCILYGIEVTYTKTLTELKISKMFLMKAFS